MRKNFGLILGTIALLGCGATVPAQGFSERFRAHNAEMSTLQPALISPLVAPDPRLLDYVRFSVSHQFTSSGAETVNWGNCRGGGVIVRKRLSSTGRLPCICSTVGRPQTVGEIPRCW